MPTIPLTQGQRARVDWCDYRELAKYKWYAQSCTGKVYAARATSKAKGRRRKIVLMHRQIAGLQHGDGLSVDHRNHDTLDNRRANLRIVTHRENHENRQKHSRYGVGVFKREGFRNPFEASLQVDGRTVHLGRFETAAEARRARRRFLEEQV